MNANIGQWLFSTLGAQQTRALLKVPKNPTDPPHPPIMGNFHPDQGAVPDLLTNAAAFTARYELPFADLWGSEIGEGAVPDKSELQARVRQADNPCLLTNNQSYVVTEIDTTDFRYVARNGRPIWEFIRTTHIFDPQTGGGNGGTGTDPECQQQLQAARNQITALQQQVITKDAEITRLRGLVPVAVPADVDKTVALLKGAGDHLDIGPGVKARFSRLGRFIDLLKARKP